MVTFYTSILHELVLKIRVYENSHHSSNVCLIQLIHIGRKCSWVGSLSVFIQEEEHTFQEI